MIEIKIPNLQRIRAERARREALARELDDALTNREMFRKAAADRSYDIVQPRGTQKQIRQVLLGECAGY